jgi:hypothetical protein
MIKPTSSVISSFSTFFVFSIVFQHRDLFLFSPRSLPVPASTSCGAVQGSHRNPCPRPGSPVPTLGPSCRSRSHSSHQLTLTHFPERSQGSPSTTPPHLPVISLSVAIMEVPLVLSLLSVSLSQIKKSLVFFSFFSFFSDSAVFIVNL